MKKTLITGIGGFAGSHLADYLVKEGLQVYGFERFPYSNGNLDQLKGKIVVESIDLDQEDLMYRFITQVRPDYIFHLAAQSYVPQSWKSPNNTFRTNIEGSANLFEAVRKSETNPVIQIACSSEEYGQVFPHECPITEINQLRPLSPYGVSKVAMDLMGWQYVKSYKMKIVRTRAFNHEGPRRDAKFVISNWCMQVARMEKNLQPKTLLVGNLKSVRDFTDVRDMAEAYYLAVQKCTPGDVYVISSGIGTEVGEVVEIIKKLSSIDFEVMQDPERMRPSDVELLIGDSSKFRKETGWKPKIPLTKTIKDTLDYWRAKV